MLEQQLKQDLQSLLTDAPYPVANAVIDIRMPSQDFVFSHAVGEAAPGIAMAVETPFHWASVGKTLTALLIFDADDRGLLGDDGIDTRLADTGLFTDSVLSKLHTRADAITLRHLLSHTSGMRDAMVDDARSLVADAGGLAPDSLMGQLVAAPDGRYNQHWQPFDADDLDNPTAGTLNFYLANDVGSAPLAAPGERFHYCDTGYVVLALLLEHINGDSLANLLRSRIFEPLSLEDTWLAYRDAAPKTVSPKQGAEILADELPMLGSGFNLSFDWGGGGQISSAQSLNRILQAVIGGELLSEGSSAQMRDWSAPPGLLSPRLAVGKGLFQTACRNGTLIGHSGALGAKMFWHEQAGIYFSGTVNQVYAPPDWHWPFIERVRNFFA